MNMNIKFGELKSEFADNYSVATQEKGCVNKELRVSEYGYPFITVAEEFPGFSHDRKVDLRRFESYDFIN